MEIRAKTNQLQKIFITGLLLLLPLLATCLLLVFLFNLLDGWLAPVGVQIMRLAGIPLPAGWNRIPGFGIAATLILIFLSGLFASHYLGRRLFQFAERLILRLPVVNQVYNGFRQVIHSFSAEGMKAFQTVVLFEFPRKGVWTMGFVTTPAARSLERAAGEKLVNVFLPAAPIPSQGVLLMISAKNMKILPITVEEALGMLTTLGLVQASNQAAKVRPETGKPPAGKKIQRR